MIAGVVLIVFGTLWMQNWSFGREEREIEAWFREVGQLQRGNAVKMRGVPIGEVAEITLDRRSTGVVVRMEIDSDVVLPEDPVVLLAPESMFGDWQAEVYPRTRFPFYDYAISPEPGVMPGYSLPDMSRLTAVADRIAENLAVITDKFNVAFTDETAVNIRQAIDNVREMTSQLTALVDAQEQTVEDLATGLEATTRSFQQAANTANRTFLQIEAALADGELEEVMDNVALVSAQMDTISRNLNIVTRELTGTMVTADSTFTSLNAIMADLEAGEGSLGRLLQDTALYGEIVLTTTLVQDLLQDFQRNPRKYINLRVF
jgi:phospholipid/cholesterol/gamma-HCH transport system substrate-binding protein